MHALQVSNIKKSFTSRGRMIRAVDGVSFCVGEGEVYGLLGMNGAGKSTTIKLCTGLLNADGGSISVFGHDITAEREAAKSLINVSPQETAVAAGLSVRENLELIAQLYGADGSAAASRAEDMMKKLDLANRARDRAGKLSGGLMRRLSVGMALITEPKLLFLDEPTLGLDVLARRELWRLIRDNCSAAVVLTTHYLEEAQAMCNRIAVMSNGKIVAEGSAEQLTEMSGKSNFEDAFIELSGAEVGHE